MIAKMKGCGAVESPRPSTCRWGVCVLLVALCPGLSAIEAVAVASGEEDGPAAERLGIEFWRGRKVIQVFGKVLRLEDTTLKATQYYWSLDESAVGTVVEVIDGGIVRVEFPDETGWQKLDVPPPETTVEFKFDYDNYGYLESVTKKITTREGIPVGPREWGRVIDEADGRRIVQFPIENLGLQRLRIGDRVKRGPDWRAGHADGGNLPVGALSPGEEECLGTVTAEADADRYVRIRWDRTDRDGVYRFDRRRYYDVERAE